MTAPRKPARSGAAPEGWQAAFLHALRQTGNVSAAARAAGTCRSRCYEARQRDRGFAAAWADALEEAADRLEMEAFRRAVEGVGEERFFRGDVVGTVTCYSDRLLMFLLKARRPARFGSGSEEAGAEHEAEQQEHDKHYLAELRRRMEKAALQDEPGAD